MRQDDEAIYIEKIDTYQKVRLYTAVGRRSPLYAGACSRVILSHLSDEEIAKYLASTELKPFADGTITNKEHLIKTIHQAQGDGYTLSHSELENHTPPSLPLSSIIMAMSLLELVLPGSEPIIKTTAFRT